MTWGPSIAGAAVRRRIVPYLVLALAAILMLLALTPYGAATSPDSIRYLDVAQNIRAGRGIVSTDAGVDPPYRSFTTYPPLYPLALASALSPDVPDLEMAARLAIVLLVLSALLVFEILRPAIGRDSALAGALLFLIAQPTLTVFTFAWSEALAVPLLLLACWASLRALDAAREDEATRHAWFLGAAVASLVALTYTRYIGIVFAILLPIGWWLTPQRRQWMTRYGAASAIVAGAAVALYARNYWLTGYLSGAARAPSTRGLGTNIGNALEAFAVQLTWAPAALTIALLAAAAAAAAHWYTRPRGAEREHGSHEYGTWVVLLCSAAAMTYLVVFVLIRTLSELDRMDTRFVVPSFALFLLALMVTACRAWTSATPSYRTAGTVAAAALLLTLVAERGVESFRASTVSWARAGSPSLPLSFDGNYYNYTIPSGDGLFVGPKVDLAELYLAIGSIDEAVEMFESAILDADNGQYRAHKALAAIYAVRSDVDRSLAHTRACLRLDAGRGAFDIIEIASPFFETPDAAARGIAYYEGLVRDVPDAWWVYANIATLSRILGDEARAVEMQGRADALRR